jgi:pimeloyl-ACP methyl ester carboxylesterase
MWIHRRRKAGPAPALEPGSQASQNGGMSPPRILLFAVLLLGACLLVGFLAPPARAQSEPSNEMFDPVAVTKGITISREACAAFERQQTAVWLELGGEGYCVRYYAAGLRPTPGTNPIAAAWLNGDVQGKNPGPPADKHQAGLGVGAMIEQERALSNTFAVPFIFVARPGTYGSSGRHWTIRHARREAEIVLLALDMLKSRYGIEHWALGGHSGGGQLVAEMLARRRDIGCAVIASGSSAYRAYLKAHGSSPVSAADLFDPLQSVDRIPVDRDRRIFVIGDPRDRNVFFRTQRLYFDALRNHGDAAWLLSLERGLAPEYHDLLDIAETATGMCAQGITTPRIVEKLKSMPAQAARVSN